MPGVREDSSQLPQARQVPADGARVRSVRRPFDCCRECPRARACALALACWHHLGSILGPLGSILGHLGSILTHLGSILGHLGSILAPAWPHLGPSWFHLGPSWLHLDPSWLHLGPSWLHLDPSWLHPCPSWLHPDSPEAPRATFELRFLRGFHFSAHLESRSSKKSQFLAPQRPPEPP